MERLSVIVTPSIFSDVTRSMAVNASQTWRKVKSSLATAVECNNNLFRLLAVERQVSRLSPVLYAVELCASRVLVGRQRGGYIYYS